MKDKRYATRRFVREYKISRFQEADGRLTSCIKHQQFSHRL